MLITYDPQDIGVNSLHYKTQIKSRQPAVTKVVKSAEQSLLGAKIGEDQTGEICLVLAEALNNVVEHAYSYREDGDIDVSLDITAGRLCIRIVDFGPAFAPPKPKENVPDLDEFEALPEGGFGWGLIQMLTEEITLERIDHRNHLTLFKTVN